MPLLQRFFSVFTAVLAGVCLSVPGLAAQGSAVPSAGQDAGETTLHLHGTVVDGVTGKPLSRALVTSVDRRLATMTNAEGSFALEVVTEGSAAGGLRGLASGPMGGGNDTGFRIFLMAQKPGYLPPGPVAVRFDGASAETSLQLMPTGTISGHVSADEADGAANVMVALLWHSSNNGERTWVTSAMQRTDRNGAFRFTNIRPGDYTVMTMEWRGDEPLPPSRTAITEQYPPVYLGDAAAMDGAARMHMHYGDATVADLHLRLTKYYPVTVPIGTAGVGVNVQVNSGEAMSGYRLGYNDADHAVEGSLPPGTYSLRVSSMAPQPAYGTAVLHVSEAPLRTAPLALVPALPITVRLHTEYTEAPPGSGPARVYLQPAMPQQGGFVTGSPKPGETEAILPDVAPGRYTVHVEPPYGYVAAIQSAGVDLLNQPLSVEPGEAVPPIDVTLRDDTAKVSGTVTTADAALPNGVFVTFFPADPGAKFMTAGVGPDGKFSFVSMVPGSYLAFALPGRDAQPWQFPWRDAEALQAVAGRGVKVTLAPGDTQQLALPLAEANALELP